MTLLRTLTPALFTLALLGGAVVLVGRAPLGVAPERPASITGRWETAGTLVHARAWGKSVVLGDGSVLVLGGLEQGAPGVTVTSTELFDPRTGRATLVEGSVRGRLHQTVTRLLDGRVLVVGGTERSGGDWSPVDTVDIYDPSARRWTSAAPGRGERSDHFAALLADGRVLVGGGNRFTVLQRDASIYDPRTGRWSAASSMPRARTQASAVTLSSGEVLIIGGMEQDGRPSRSTLLYDPVLNAWRDGPDLLAPRMVHATVPLPGGDVLVIGGQDRGATTAERYDARANTFVHAGRLVEPRILSQAALLADGRVLVVGGLPVEADRFPELTAVASAEVWDPRTDSWSAVSDAPTARAWGQLLATPAGVLRIGGIGTGERAFREVERYR